MTELSISGLTGAFSTAVMNTAATSQRGLSDINIERRARMEVIRVIRRIVLCYGGERKRWEAKRRV